MGFFGIQYQVLFHDTMAYGSHHYMTNFKFQNYARETLLFETQVDGKSVWQEELKHLVLLTREAYTLNMGPVVLGEKVGVLMTYEAPTRSTVRLCFRVVREDGLPVSCGYQTMVFMNKDTFELEPAPTLVAQYLDTKNEYCVLEKLQNPSFADILKEGGSVASKIFTDQMIDLGQYIATAPRKFAYPKIIDVNKNEYDLGESLSLHKEIGNGKIESSKPEKGKPEKGKTVFTFPGQGSYHYAILRDFYSNYKENSEVFFQKANETTKKLLGKSFLPLVEAGRQEDHDILLAQFPDLDQIGIYLTEVLIARKLLSTGWKPDLLLGHSFGEIAALAVAGVYSFDTGLEIVCHRIKALQTAPVGGKMAALTCDVSTSESIIKELNLTETQIAVVNKKNQTVLSGTEEELSLLSHELPKRGISVSILKSNYAFHSKHLKASVEPYKADLARYDFNDAKIPVYHCTENSIYKSDSDLPEILSNQFVKTLNFVQITDLLFKNNFTTFIECGGGDIVTKLVTKNQSEAIALFTALPSEALSRTLDSAIRSASQKGWLKSENKIEIRVENPAKIARQDKAQPKSSNPATDKAVEMPIAIVSMGSILPGAKNPEEYWNNLIAGKSGIVNLTELDPNAEKDFMAGHVRGMDIELVPDKSYSLLNGTIIKIEYEAHLLKDFYSKKEFDQLTRGQRMLALSLAQNFQSQKDRILSTKADKIQCILGATADGISEYDEAIFYDGVLNVLDQLGEGEKSKQAYAKILTEISGYKKGDSKHLEQSKIYSDVVKRFLHKEIKTYIVDTACSSSLYAMDFGIKALRNKEADVILAGGVFAPGPSNNTLFAQFRGLSPSGSHPLDESADGVIFADGSAILVLRRLDDAIESGDKILGVIRGMGLSSDGKTPSINVPKSDGQRKAIERALDNANVDIDSLQYIEMHATATPVGDSVEFNSIKSIAKDRNPSLPKIQIGSVKSLIGHTGWVSGAASVIKICKGFENKVMPKQYHFKKPNAAFDFDGSNLNILTKTKDWNINIENLPMRAGINGFGFGGTNAHVVIESYDEQYHRHLLNYLKPPKPAHQELGIIGVCNLFPGDEGQFQNFPSGTRKFDRKNFRLPKKKLLLPDVTDNMDASQYLAPLAAEQILEGLGDKWNSFKGKIGIVFGLESKTERGIMANERILSDRLKRLVREYNKQDNNNFIELTDAITNYFKEHNHISGPYTLPGLMPNVAPSRITSLYNLNGPNMIVDAGKNSFFQALLAAEQLLINNDCQIIFCGGIGAYAGIDDAYHEATCFYAMSTLEFAKENNFEIEAVLNISGNSKENDLMPKSTEENGLMPKSTDKFDYRGANGGVAFLGGLQRCAGSKDSFVIEGLDKTCTEKFILRKNGTEHVEPDIEMSKKGLLPDEIPSTHAYVQGTPIYQYEPSLFTSNACAEEVSLEGKKILFLTDQTELWSLLEKSQVLDPFNYKVAAPTPNKLKNGVLIDLSSDDASQKCLKAVGQERFDVVVAVKFLKNHSPDDLLLNNFSTERGLIDLLFATSKYYYHDIYKGQISIASLCMGAWYKNRLNPYTGLVNGFMKSVSRELTTAKVRMVNTDENNFLKAIHQLEVELGQTRKDWEVTYRKGQRYIFKLVPVKDLTKDNQACINKDSVIIATGGGRGVTAVLAEELLKTYGCTIIGLGRTSPDSAPQKILETDPMEFLTSEAQFYKDEIAADKTQRIIDLKKKFQTYQAANEVYHSIKSLNNFPGKFIYKMVDIKNENEVDEFIRTTYKEYGKVDMVIHGAGIQKSGMLANKPLEVFQNVVATKMTSIGYLYRAIHKNNISKAPVHYHLLTSTFSVLGNDGQPDYGAANEALNRIAANMGTEQPSSYWSSMAWLGWAGIGMTRSTEYAALAASRRLRGVTKEEGQRIFAALMKGRPTAPINVTMADGEFEYYEFPKALEKEKSNFEIHIPGKSKKNKIIEKKLITVENTEFLKNHMVNDIPTVPGALLTCIASEAAIMLRPGLMINEFENTNSFRFVRVNKNQGIEIRIVAEVIAEDKKRTTIKTRILSDFVHKSGRILQKDILHNESLMHMSKEIAPQPEVEFWQPKNSASLPDPYCLNDVVKLRGQFNSMYNIQVGGEFRRAEYQLKDFDFITPHNYLVPNMMLMDAFWRFGSIQLVGGNRLAVYVPEKCRSMKVYYDFTDFENQMLGGHFLFSGINPTSAGQNLDIGQLVARNKEGKIMLIGEGGFARKFGEVQFEIADNVLG